MDPSETHPMNGSGKSGERVESGDRPQPLGFFQAIRLVWVRYFMVYRRNIWYGMVTTFVEPLLYLVSFGFGVGGMIGELEISGIRVTYRQFVFAGVAAQTVLFQGFFEAAYGGFIRMYYQRIFQAIAVTPITVSEILWGELLWDASKATSAAMAVFMIGVVSGDFRVVGIFAYLPVVFICALLFAGMGLLTAARARSIDEISYPQFLLVFPMFLFCGVFFPLHNLPDLVRGFVWLLPLTGVIDLLRAITLGLPLFWASPLLILFWLVVLVTLSRRAMFSRLVK